MKNFTDNTSKLLSAIIILLLAGNFASAQTGLLNYNFDTDGDTEGWYIVNYSTGGTAEVSGGSFNIIYNLDRTDYNRANLKIDDVVVNPGSYPILAVKWTNAPIRTFQLHCNLGTYKNDGTLSNHDGVVNDDIYYYDLTNFFGSSKNYLSTTEPTTLDYLQWKVTENISEGTTGYSIDWVRTYESVAALEAAFSVTAVAIEDQNSKCSVLSGNNMIVVTGCESNSKVELYDVSGKLIRSLVATSNRMNVSCSPGIYIVKVTGGSTFVDKAVVY